MGDSETPPPPSLAGFDSEAGLRRVGGNIRLYVDLLRQFVDGHADAGARIAQSLASGDRKTAERIAHSVKGVAANIGGTTTQAAAGAVEKAIRSGAASEIEIGLPVLVRELDELTAHLRSYLKDHPLESASENDYAVVDEQAVDAAAGEILPLLEESDPRASDVLRDRRPAFRALLGAAELARFESLVGGYSFDDAMDLMKAALQRRKGEA